MGSSKAPKQPDPLPAAKATAEANKDVAQYTTALDRPTQVDPYGQTSWQLRAGADPNKPMPGDWTQTTTLSPQQQSLLNLDVAAQQGAYGLGLNALQAAGQSGTGAPIDLGGLQSVRQVQTPTLPGAQDYTQQGQQIRDALYEQMTQFSNERFGREEEALRNQLVNQGFAPGAEGFNTELSEFRRGKDESYRAAELAAILAGGQEQSRVFGDTMTAAQAGFGNEYQVAGLEGAQRQQQLQEQLLQRQTPLNEALAIAGMTGVTNPAYQPFNLSQPWQPVNYSQVQQQQYQGDVNQANFQNAQRSQTLGTVGTIASAVAMAW